MAFSFIHYRTDPMDDTKMKAEGEHSILGSYCLELGTYDKMKKELIFPKSLQNFSVAIEVFTLMCKENRKKLTLSGC